MRLFKQFLQRTFEKVLDSFNYHGFGAAMDFLGGKSTAEKAINDTSSKVSKDTLYHIAQEGAELAAHYLAPGYPEIAKVGANIATKGLRATIEGQDVRKVIKEGLVAASTLAAAPLGPLAPLGGCALQYVTDIGVDKASDVITHAYTNYTNAADQKAFQAKAQNYRPNMYVQERVNELNESFILVKAAAPAA